jgi:hypothetical protein
MQGAASIGASAAAPRIDQALLPASVQASPAARHAYEEGLGFEEMLTEELTRSLVQSDGLGVEGEGEGEGEAGALEADAQAPLGAGGSLVGSLLPRVLSESIVGGGGIGLAAQLEGELAPATAEAKGIEREGEAG